MSNYETKEHHHSSHSHHHRRSRMHRMKKWIRETSKKTAVRIGFLVVFLLAFVVVMFIISKVDSGSYDTSSETVDNFEKKEIEAALDTYLPGFVCWGDSQTGQGWVSSLDSVLDEELTEYLEYRLYKNGTSWNSIFSVPVINMGVDGDTSVAVAGRSGAIPFVLSRGLSIPADTSAVTIELECQNGSPVESLPHGTGGMEWVEIAGVKGSISMVQDSSESGSCRYEFQRSETGEAISAKAGTEIVTQGSVEYQNYIPMIYISQDGGYEDMDDLIAQQQAMIDHGTGPDERYLIIGKYTGDAESQAELESAMQEAWGNHYINLRDYLSGDGMDDAGMVATEEDLAQMKKGEVPDSLLKDGTQLTEKAEDLIANLIYNRMDELGFFDEVRQAVSDAVGQE